MRFLKLELPGAPNVEVLLHHRMTVVDAGDEAERHRLGEALAGRGGGVVWAFDEEDAVEEHLPISDFAVLGLPLDVASAMPLRAQDIPIASAVPEPFQPDPAPVAEPAAVAEMDDAPRRELEARRAQLVARRAGEGVTADHTALARALSGLRAAEEYAGALADDAWQIRAEWAPLAAALETPGPSDEAVAAVELARAALVVRREELAAAREAVGQGPLTPEDVAAIARLHDEVTNAQERADRPFPGQAARRRLAEAEAAETKFLQDRGFSSYTGYLLDAVARPADPEPLRRLADAERALAEAEVTWQSAAPTADELSLRQSLQRQATRLRGRAAALLGADPGDAVSESLADWPNSCARLHEARAILEDALRAAGAGPGPDPAAAAEAWLATGREEAAERAALESELSEVEAELAALQRAADSRAAQAEARPTATIPPAEDSEGQDLDAYLLAQVARRRHVGPIGSVPLVLEDAFAALAPPARRGGLARLAEMAATVQVVYVTTDPDVLAWAGTIRSEDVAVTRPEQVVPAVSAPAVHDSPVLAPFIPASPAVSEQRLEAPRPLPVPAPSQAWCKECGHDLAVGQCDRCHASFCLAHLVRMKRSTRPPLCLSCALAAAGARSARRF
jgi:hypothetical protein